MTFPVHRSDEATPEQRGEAFGRAMAPQVQHTVAVYRRMFAERRAHVPDTLPAHPEIDAIARGADVDAQFLRAVNARTEIIDNTLGSLRETVLEIRNLALANKNFDTGRVDLISRARNGVFDVMQKLQANVDGRFDEYANPVPAALV